MPSTIEVGFAENPTASLFSGRRGLLSPNPKGSTGKRQKLAYPGYYPSFAGSLAGGPGYYPSFMGISVKISTPRRSGDSREKSNG
eukprot:1330758-Amorphochlora_amoeboformis.AAC.3